MLASFNDPYILIRELRMKSDEQKKLLDSYLRYVSQARRNATIISRKLGSVIERLSKFRRELFAIEASTAATEVNRWPHTGNGRSASCHHVVVSVTRTYLASIYRRDDETNFECRAIDLFSPADFPCRLYHHAIEFSMLRILKLPTCSASLSDCRL